MLLWSADIFMMKINIFGYVGIFVDKFASVSFEYMCPQGWGGAYTISFRSQTSYRLTVQDVFGKKVVNDLQNKPYAKYYIEIHVAILMLQLLDNANYFYYLQQIL